MITRLEVKNYRMLRANSVSLPPFSVLVGKNATGKSTLLGVLRFVSELVRGGVAEALAGALERDAPNFAELCFDPRLPIEIALELAISERLVRYELRIGPGSEDQVVIQREQLWIRTTESGADKAALQLSLWTSDQIEVVHHKMPSGWRKVMEKNESGKDYFQDERTNWNNVFKFGPTRAALGAIPEDETRFPLALRVRDLLRDGVITVELDSAKLRQPSVPRSPPRLVPDGSNLARAVQALRASDPVAYQDWVASARTAVEGLDEVDVWERPEDKKMILRASFGGHHHEPVPSWLLSDGTLRLLALSLLSYTDGERGAVMCIEEPENGLHPLAMQAVHSALSQPPPGGQILVATHSPVFLAQVSLDQALVFRRQGDGSAQVLRGPEVKELREWRSSASVADVFATGVLA